MEVAEARARVCDEVDARADRLLAVSHEIHAHPELCFEERRAHEVLTGALADAGLAVEQAAYGLDTAFAARAGREGPTVAVICEYDALPEIGHACGHNIIAAAGLGAGIAAAGLAEDLGGRVLVLGTPAEEGGGGKVRLLEAGALGGVDAALMVHPADLELTEISALAVDQVLARFSGTASHAAAAPEKGRNALDAAVLAYMNLAALRQHIGPRERIHGIFTDGGHKPNIVPDRAAQHWYVRAPDLEALDALRPRVMAALEAGAAAAGCEIETEWIGPCYAELVTNDALLSRYLANARALGRDPQPPTGDRRVVGSTDMGNVSHVVPAIHPMVAVAPPGVSIHSQEFARCAASPAGDQGVLDGAKALAMTVVDLWGDPDVLAEAREEHRRRPDRIRGQDPRTA